MSSFKDNLRVGKPDTTQDAPAHTPGVKQGNEPGDTEKDPGIIQTGRTGAGRPSARSTAWKSTGVDPEARNPIDPNSPNLPPA